MNILIDLTYIKKESISGVATNALRLIKGFNTIGSSHNIILLVLKEKAYEFKNRFPNNTVLDIPHRASQISLLFPHINSFLYKKDLESIIRSESIDILLSPYLYIGSFVINSIPHIGILHDSQSYILNKDKKIKSHIYRFFMNRILNRATRIITISNYSKHSIQTVVTNLKTPISVIYNSVEAQEAKSCDFIYDLKPYILNVNTIEPYKNLETLVKAFVLIKDNVPHKLVIKGKRLPYWDNVVLPIIKENNIEKRVVLLDRAMHEEVMASIYCEADLFVTPSLMEGFGFTPIEAAMYCVPVISTKETALYETTRGLVNYYEPPKDEKILADKIQSVLTRAEQQQSLNEIAKELTECYSLSNQARSFIDIIEKTVFRK